MSFFFFRIGHAQTNQQNTRFSLTLWSATLNKSMIYARIRSIETAPRRCFFFFFHMLFFKHLVAGPLKFIIYQIYNFRRHHLSKQKLDTILVSSFLKICFNLSEQRRWTWTWRSMELKSKSSKRIPWWRSRSSTAFFFSEMANPKNKSSTCSFWNCIWKKRQEVWKLCFCQDLLCFAWKFALFSNCNCEVCVFFRPGILLRPYVKSCWSRCQCTRKSWKRWAVLTWPVRGMGETVFLFCKVFDWWIHCFKVHDSPHFPTPDSNLCDKWSVTKFSVRLFSGSLGWFPGGWKARDPRGAAVAVAER